jgi:ribosome maturation factor RimP
VSLSQNELEKIRRLAEEVASREGCKLYDVEFGNGAGSRRTLRVFIERLLENKPDTNDSSPEPEAVSAEGGADIRQGLGASLEDCVNVSRGLNLMLDVEDPIPGGRYELEVSTPGIERKLTQLWHFEQAKGRKASIRFEQDDGTPRTMDAVIKDVVGNKIVTEGKLGTIEIEFPKIEKAKRVFEAPVKGKKR